MREAAIAATVSAVTTRRGQKTRRTPSVVMVRFLRNLKAACETDKWSEVARRTGIEAGKLYTWTWKGQEVPKVEDVLALAARLGVLLDTLLCGIDANYDAVAQRLRGVTGKTVQAGDMTTHQTHDEVELEVYRMLTVNQGRVFAALIHMTDEEAGRLDRFIHEGRHRRDLQSPPGTQSHET